MLLELERQMMEEAEKQKILRSAEGIQSSLRWVTKKPGCRASEPQAEMIMSPM